MTSGKIDAINDAVRLAHCAQLSKTNPDLAGVAVLHQMN
jgi:hypothetical protein